MRLQRSGNLPRRLAFLCIGIGIALVMSGMAASAAGIATAAKTHRVHWENVASTDICAAPSGMEHCQARRLDVPATATPVGGLFPSDIRNAYALGTAPTKRTWSPMPNLRASATHSSR